MSAVLDITPRSFDDVLGARRGDIARGAAEGAWRATLGALRAAGRRDPADVELLASALTGDLHAGWRHTATCALTHFGAGSTKARRVVVYRGKTMHLLDIPFGEQAHVHPTTLCNRMLDSFAARTQAAARGAWAQPEFTVAGIQLGGHLKRCQRCERHAEQVPEAAEPREHDPFFPEQQAPFAAALGERCRALGAAALCGELGAGELGAGAERTYRELLLEHAVAHAHAYPARARRAGFPDCPDAFHLRAELGWPGELDELLADVNWRALFSALVPKDRRDGYHTTIMAWQAYREALRAQLAAIAARRVAARRVELARSRVAELQVQLASAQAELDTALNDAS